MTALRTTLLVLSGLLAPIASAEELDSAVGKALFDRKWVQAPASTNAADGLGPLFNAQACATCHKNGGGARFSMIDGVLGVAGFVVRLGDAHGAADPLLGRQLQDHAIPGLAPEARIAPYLAPDADGLTRMLAKITFTQASPEPGVKQEYRVAPPLLGRGLIARVAQSEVVRRADPGDRDGDGISGRVRIIRTAEGSRIGRFGLKATAASLADQTADAAMLDLGLSSPFRPEPYGDCTPGQTRCRASTTGRSSDLDGEEISRAMVDMVANYVAALRARPVPADPEGERLLAATGCTSCHVPSLGAGSGASLPVFTDLLLHDMGNGLAGAFPDDFATANEWRTAPLIDLAAQKGKRRFLHDGRAATLDEAIRWHGGEAVKAKERYLELPAEAKAWLIGYLGSL
ncbi:MAG: di-heme oxidoredictase family protein [Parvibaculaceae bacterium]